MTLLYKVMNSVTPQLTKDPIPTPHQSRYYLRSHDAVGPMGQKLKHFNIGFILIAYLNGIRLTQR